MVSLTTLFLSNNNLILHATLAISLSLFLSFFKIPSFFLHGLHTYIHPDDVTPNANKSSTRAAIRRPGSIESDKLKPRKKSKERFEFDENKAQIFRLKLTEGHLESRIYYKEFYGVFNSTFIALSSFLLHTFLNVDKDLGFVKNGSIIPLLLGLVAVCRVCFFIVRVGFERSASKTLDKQLSVIWGVLGFVVGLAVVSNVVIPRRVLYFSIEESLTGFGMTLLAVLMGGVVGFLYMPSLRNARAIWIGTDQIRSNLSIISCGWFSRGLIYVNYVLVVFTSLLWITPFADFLVKTNSGNMKSVIGVEGMELAGYIGISSADFHQLRTCCLLFTGLIQIITMRPNVQMFLNEAVLCWYQRLHASKLPDLDYSRAKVFLHNHYLCLAVLQFFAPGALVLLLLGFSQFDGNFLSNNTELFNKLVVFMAWWIVFVWAVFNTAILALYRRGNLYVS